MKIRYLKILLVLYFFLNGCEDINDVESEIEYRELIVVQAELKDNIIFDGVSLTRTLPIGEAFNIKKAEIINAEAYLIINNLQVIPLHYSQDGIYKPLNDLVISSGNIYEFFAQIDDKEIYSKTRVPVIPEVKNIVFENNYILVNIVPKPDEVYGAMWIIQSGTNNVISRAEDFYSITEPEGGTSSGLLLRTQSIPNKYITDFYKEITDVQVYSFDKPFFEYFKSKVNNRAVNDPFIQSGGAVAWNVYGENVIGLFIGVSEGGKLKAE